MRPEKVSLNVMHMGLGWIWASVCVEQIGWYEVGAENTTDILYIYFDACRGNKLAYHQLASRPILHLCRPLVPVE